MATEPNTGLTLSPAGPLQADLIVNPIIRRLGAVGGNTAPVQDKDLATPPTLNTTTDVGKRYIVASSPTGAWVGHATHIAYWNGIGWDFYVPVEGYLVTVLDEHLDYRFNNSNVWAVASSFLGGSLTSALNEAKGSNIASAATTDIGAATGNLVHITGTTTITALGTIQAGTRREVVFDGILILTHNATSLILPTGANVTTAVGDCAEFISEGSGNWRCTSYNRADGTSLGGAPGSVTSINGRTGVVTLTAADTPTTINSQTASYTLVLTDAGKWVDMDNASANALTVPPNSSVAFVVGTEIHVRQKGAGPTTMTAGAGVTLQFPASQSLVLKEQFAVVSIKKIATDTWTVFGLLA
jgi:hypothetical protein